MKKEKRISLLVVLFVLFIFLFGSGMGWVHLQFKPKLLLEKMWGKILLFVGDSLNRNQWESMVNVVQSVIHPGKRSLTKEGSFNIFGTEATLLASSSPQFVPQPVVPQVTHSIMMSKLTYGQCYRYLCLSRSRPSGENEQPQSDLSFSEWVTERNYASIVGLSSSNKFAANEQTICILRISHLVTA